jgi:hypothetical protein
VKVTFRFNITKATEAACQFAQRKGGAINIMKLVKLVYLHFARAPIPLLGQNEGDGLLFA